MPNYNSNYPFSALLSRMKYITRWGLMRSSRAENLSEHTAETAQIAHILGLIAVSIGQNVRPETLAVAALYHDVTEIITGDLPTPVKYRNNQIKAAYKNIEAESAETLAQLLPQNLQPQMLRYINGSTLSAEEEKLLKAADRLSALIKCIEEENSGNTEFKTAKKQQYRLIEEMQCEPANVFVQHFLPCYNQTLDELTGEA